MYWGIFACHTFWGFGLFLVLVCFFYPCKIEIKLFFSPEAWTSMMYWCKSCPCWMTSKVMLFMASFRSVWRCNRCSARVRSSVLKSFICLSRSSFQASNSAVTFKGRRQTLRISQIPHSQCLDQKILCILTLIQKPSNSRSCPLNGGHFTFFLGEDPWKDIQSNKTVTFLFLTYPKWHWKRIPLYSHQW